MKFVTKTCKDTQKVQKVLLSPIDKIIFKCIAVYYHFTIELINIKLYIFVGAPVSLIKLFLYPDA